MTQLAPILWISSIHCRTNLESRAPMDNQIIRWERERQKTETR